MAPNVCNGRQRRAQTYNVANDWLTTYPTTTALNAATTATWGVGHAWSAGQLSSNWTGNNSAVYNGPGFNILPTYYNPSTGYLNSGGTQVGTFTYTVPFQAYQLNPGSTIHLAVGTALTEQISSGLLPFAGANSALTLPTNTTVFGSASSGLLQEVGKISSYATATNVKGFDTTSWTTSSFHDGTDSILNSPAGVFYNYSSNATFTGVAAFNAPKSAGDPLITGGTSYSTVTMNATLTPSYVGWTAPATGTVALNVNAWDVGTNSNDGMPSFFVMTSTGGPTAPLLSAIGFSGSPNGTPEDARFTSNMSAVQGTLSAIAALSGYNGNGGGFGLNWQSGFINVTAGETLYFVADASHVWTPGWTAHAYEGFQDPIALSVVINATPEPSSFLLMAMAGLALAAWKWRRFR